MGPQVPGWAAHENGKETRLWPIEWGSICCSSVRSPTPSHTQPFQIKWAVYFSKNYCVSLWFCMHLHMSIQQNLASFYTSFKWVFFLEWAFRGLFAGGLIFYWSLSDNNFPHVPRTLLIITATVLFGLSRFFPQPLFQALGNFSRGSNNNSFYYYYYYHYYY